MADPTRRQGEKRIGRPRKRGPRANPATHPDLAAEQAELDRKIVEMRRKGYQFTTIAEKLKMHESAVRQTFYRVLRQMPANDVEELRREQAERLGRTREQLTADFDRVGKRKDKGLEQINARASLASQLLNIEKHEADLFGLKAPVKAESLPVGPDREEMAALIQKNLSTDEQRELVRLLMKARGVTPDSEVPAIETTANRVEDTASAASDPSNSPLTPPSMDDPMARRDAADTQDADTQGGADDDEGEGQ